MLEGLREWWENTVYSLEERGIPNWVLPLAILIVLALAYLFFFPSKPAGGTVTITVFSADGSPIENALVSLSSTDEGDFSKTLTTDSSGSVSFDSVPAGEFETRVSSQDFAFAEGGVLSLSVGKGQDVEKTFFSVPSQSSKVSLSVSIDGPKVARIQLLDSSGIIVKETFGATALFNADPDSSYTIKASAEGYTEETVPVSVGKSDVPLIKITLLPIGIEKKGVLFVGVFDDIGVDGTAIENASVTVFDAETNHVLFSLTTGEAGTVEKQELPLGQKIRLVVDAKDFERQSREVNVSSETTEKFRLSKSTEPKGFFLRISDEKGDPVANAIVQLISGKTIAGEQTSSLNGIASFPAVETTKSFDVVAFKTGFLPFFKEKVSSGEWIALEKATDENTGSILVKVLDKRGDAVEGAFVLLQDAQGKPIGFPARKTSVDGTQAWE
ncbi:MAG: carboxypeptidase-like regulatory domain-containing protein, partial [Candidatus Micrarchaeota archaeon]